MPAVSGINIVKGPRKILKVSYCSPNSIKHKTDNKPQRNVAFKGDEKKCWQVMQIQMLVQLLTIMQLFAKVSYL
jgi:hypothetical protein